MGATVSTDPYTARTSTGGQHQRRALKRTHPRVPEHAHLARALVLDGDAHRQRRLARLGVAAAEEVGHALELPVGVPRVGAVMVCEGIGVVCLASVLLLKDGGLIPFDTAWGLYMYRYRYTLPKPKYPSNERT